MRDRTSVRGGGVRTLLILGGLSAFGPLSLDMYLPALPSLARNLHTSPAPVQVTLTGCLIGLALGQLFTGPISDAYGRRRPLLIGLLVYAVTSAACAVSPSVWLLAALRILQGLAGGALTAPLVGVAGSGTDIPMAAVIAVLSLIALGSSALVLHRPAPAAR